jgi:isochorismate synthase
MSAAVSGARAEHARWAGLGARFASAVEAASPRGEPLVLAHPAPVAPPLRLFAARPELEGVLFEPPGEAAVAGLGVAVALEAAGPRRAEALLARVRALFETCAVRALAERLPPRPRLFGGLGFDGGAPAEAAHLGAARFVLPRWTYLVEQGEAWLLLALSSTAGESPAALEAEAERLVDALAAPERARAVTPSRVERSGPEAWARGVEAVRASIADGRAQKVVLSHRTELEAASAFDPAAVLAGLEGEAVGATRFAFRRGEATFLGATPERLVRRMGREVRTEALAGSARAGASAAASLLESPKDRAEQGHVVRWIERGLSRFAERVTVPETPVLRRLPHVVHLHTPIAATLLAPPAHVLTLVAALHPTPAVAGVPLEEALASIRAHEPDGRGWYAGPVGWLDAEGDGDFWVALRSALLVGSRARLYAGAGIVEGSDAALEYAETVLKERTMLAALGAVG